VAAAQILPPGEDLLQRRFEAHRPAHEDCRAARVPDWHVSGTVARIHEVAADPASNRCELGFALQVLTVRFLGTFLPNPTEVPAIVIGHVAMQLDIADVACLPRYLDREQTRHAHRAEAA